jgi:hypothetical protein
VLSAARNRTPVSADAGDSVMVTGSPECSPMPVKLTCRRMVRCLFIFGA